MATLDSQQSWLLTENSTDCSLGFCTISCPQWCYDLFTPPPHFSLTTDFKDHTTAFSPLFITIIGVLAIVLLLFTYYTLVTKLCGSLWFQTDNSRHHANPSGNYEEEEAESDSEYYHHESWHLSSSNGLDEAFIRKITVCRYKRGEGLVEGTECSVCLSEFIEDESLRLLPKCCHAFHLQCIDTWLKSHSNCPLCRVNIQPQSLVSEEDSRGENRAASAAENELDAVVIDIENLDMENEGNMVKELEVMEMKKDGHGVVLTGSARRGRGERGKARGGRSRCLHCVMSPIRMKRSVSSCGSWLARQGRGRVRGRGRRLFLPGWGKGAKTY